MIYTKNKFLYFSLVLGILNIIIFYKFVNAMSVITVENKKFKAHHSKVDNQLIIVKDNTQEVLDISKVKTIIFDDETLESEIKNEKENQTLNDIPSDVKEILNKVPDKSKFPNAGGYVILDEDIYTLNEDGTYKIRTHYIFKIFEDRAVDQNLVLSYAFERESANIVMARTIQEDGKVYNLNLKDVKIGEAFRGAQYYTNTHKLISATLPNVKKGSIIEYIVERNVFKPIIEGYFCPTVYFVSNEPIGHLRVEIRVPKNKKMYWIAKNFDKIYDSNFEKLKEVKEPKIIETEKEKIFLFEVKDIPELISEISMPVYKDALPYVQFSAYENWDKIYDWFISHFDNHVNAISDELKNKTYELVKDCKDTEEKIATIYHYVQQQNRYISIKGDLVAGLTGHDAKRTFENKYGDCVDKAILMAAMLQVIGIKAYPTLINAGGAQWAIEVPHLDLNHSISYIVYDSKEIFLDSTSQDSRFPFFRADNHDRYTMIPQLRKIIKTNMPLSTQKTFRNVILNEDGSINVSGKREFDGVFEYHIRMYNKNLKEDEIKEMYKQRLNTVLPGVNLKKIEYTDLMNLNIPVVEKIEYSAPNFAIKAKNLLLFSVPGYSFSFNEISLLERKYPIDYQYLTKTENVFEFKIPKNYKINYVPNKLEVVNQYVKFTAEYEVKDNETIVFKDSFERLKRVVDPMDYKNYKSDLEKIMKYTNEKVVIEKIN